MTMPVIISALALLGSSFILIAAVGIVRMPDLFLRLQVTSKASVLGLTCILLAVALYFANAEVAIRAGVIICFIVMTIPVATHMLARAGYATNVPLSDETVVNELVGQYDPRTHVLSGQEAVHWEFEIAPDVAAVGKRIADLGLPEDVLILAIRRDGKVIVPRGGTVLVAQDQITVLAKPEQVDELQETFGVVAIGQFYRVEEE